MKIYNKRKQNRLQNYDYSQSRIYFVTICAKNGKMVINDCGKIVLENLLKITTRFENVFLDEYVVMPNHIHAIIEINNNIVGTDLVSVQNIKGQTQGLSLRNMGMLSRVVQAFKSISVGKYIEWSKSKNFFVNTKIWQRSFYDHIIRNEISLNKIREYIRTNPGM